MLAVLSFPRGSTSDPRDDARVTAMKGPCDVAAAILGMAGGSKAAAHQGRWTATGSPSCGGPRLAARPVVLTVMPENQELIGWQSASVCPSGPSGPRVVPGKRADFYDIALTVRNDKMLDFEVTPHHVDFDDKGRKVHDVAQNCADVVGTIYLDVQPGAAEKRKAKR
jgi:hypothetical protein